jgi:hypothetical protein
MLVAEIRNRHVLDEVFTQDGHFLLRGEMSAGLFHWGSLSDAPLSSSRARLFQFRLKLDTWEGLNITWPEEENQWPQTFNYH